LTQRLTQQAGGARALGFARTLASRIAMAAAVVAGFALLTAFETGERIDDNVIKALPKSFRLQVIEGDLAPTEATFRRADKVYVNDAPVTNGLSVMSASWITVHELDAEAVLFQYPSTDSLGQTIYRLDYALEIARNRYRIYRLDETRLVASLNTLESAVRRGDAGRRDRRAYRALTEIWNAHASRNTIVAGQPFHVRDLDDVNTLIDYSRRLPSGQKIILSTPVVVELYKE
jgi:hypothetical protein